MIELKNVSFLYRDGFNAIKNVSLSINKGDSIGIIGENGAGKSTLLKLLIGLLFPVNGEIFFEGYNIDKKLLPLMRQKIGMVFQNSDDQLFMPNVYEDIAFGPRNYKLSENDVDIRVKNALQQVGISHLIDKATFNLSGGEKRSVAIASVLSMNPEILIMDEPTTSLDPKGRRSIINLLNRFYQTKVITSHDLDFVLETCKRTIVLKQGEIVYDSNTKDILFNWEILNKCGLEEPLSFKNCPKCKARKIKF